MKTLSTGRFPPLCFTLETATQRAQHCSRVATCADPKADISNLHGLEFPLGSTREGAALQREAYILSKALPLRRNLVPRRELRSPRSLGPLLHPCPQSQGLCLRLSILPNLRSPRVMRTLRWDQGSPTSLLAKDRHIQPGQYLADKRLAWCLQLDPGFLRILPGLPGDMADKMGNPSKGRVPHSSSCKTSCSVKGSYSWENGRPCL